MIRRLDISNYAIIESLQIDFSDQLNIITGETGSGKSILLGALGLVLGRRADTKVLHDATKKCIVEAEFAIDKYQLEAYFTQEDLDYESNTIIRREISSTGKSRAFVNDTPVNLKVLQGLTTRLVDTHQQFENLAIADRHEQVVMLDAVADAIEQRLAFAAVYADFQELNRTREQLQSQHQEAVRQRDFVQFQLDELLAFELDVSEDTGLEQRLHTLTHMEEVLATAGSLSHQLVESDQSIVGALVSLRNQLDPLRSAHRGLAAVAERLSHSIIELEDLAAEAAQISEESTLDPQRLVQVRERLDQLNHLLHKHQVQDPEALAKTQQAFESQIEDYDGLEANLAELDKQISETRTRLVALGNKLSARRKAAIPGLEKRVNKQLEGLKMKHARFRVELEPDEDSIGADGLDRIAFLFAPNLGSDFARIKDVASGGELARLSLVLKSMVADSLDLPTLIFDEIDSGVSGDVAQKMGEILRALASRHQVVSITHSPQVAARGAQHLKVYKEHEGKNTRTRIKALSKTERIEEIATMLSKSPPSEHAVASAKELLES